MKAMFFEIRMRDVDCDEELEGSQFPLPNVGPTARLTLKEHDEVEWTRPLAFRSLPPRKINLFH